MSRRSALVLLAAIGLMGSLSLIYFNGPRVWISKSELSSLAPAQSSFKAASLKPRFEQLIKTSKLKPPLRIELQNLTYANEVEPGQVFQLQAQISTDQPIDLLKYEWILPEGIEVQSHSVTSGEFSLKDVRQSVYLQISLVQVPVAGQEDPIWLLSKESFNKLIHLRVYQDQPENRFVTTAQYNTMIQTELRIQREELAQRNSEYITESQKPN